MYKRQGAGKSTIVKIMVGLYEIDSGEILINGIPLHEYSNKSVKRLFSVMLQDFPTYSLTLRKNVALSDIDRADDERILASLQKAGVDDDLCDLDRYTVSYTHLDVYKRQHTRRPDGTSGSAHCADRARA